MAKKKLKKAAGFKGARVVLAFFMVCRLFVPLLIFVNPLIAWVSSLFFDGFDGQLFWESGINWKVYNAVDKVLDYWWYLFILTYFYLEATEFIVIALALLAYRTLGQVVGVVMSYEKAYLVFPNLYEWFFVFAVIVGLGGWLALGLALLTAMFFEWLIHSSNLHIVSKYIFKREISWKK